jgi:type IX secretion system PorP/SprF family membrane protein
MKTKRFIFFFFLGFFVGEMQAQFDAQFSLYAENQEAINPGAVAENDLVNLFGIYRQQWAWLGKNTPANMFFSVNAPISIAGTKHGVGLSFFDSSAGLFINQSVLLQYSYKMQLLDGVLGLGLNVGYVNQTFDRSNADPTGGKGKLGEGDDYHNPSDPFFSAADENAIAFDAGVGCFFSNKEMYAGISVLHLGAPTLDYGTTATLYIPRVFYLTGGYNISLSDPLYHLKPSTLVKTDFSSFQMELTALLEYDKKFQGGISYRFSDAFVFIVGINLLSGLYAAFSYDLPTSKMIRTGGSAEIALRYSFKPEFARRSKYKSVDIL